MKKLCYEVEEKPTIMYIVFSCFLIFILIVSAIIMLLTGEPPSCIGVIALIFFIFFICRIIFIDDKKRDKNRQELINIKNNGIKTEGTLIKLNRYTTRNFDEHRIDYTVTVEYINPYTNEKSQYETPKLSFDAHHSLGSKKCSVYILDDKIYVTDFVKKNKGEENIWAQEDDYYKKLANLEKKELKKIIIVIIFVLFILLWMGILIFNFF